MTAHPSTYPSRFGRADYKTLGLAALGGALEIYNFIIFVFFALVLSELFFPPQIPEWLRLLQSFGIFVTGYLARPLGGILLAHFADRLGRKRVFSLRAARWMARASPVFADKPAPTVIAPVFRFCARQLLPQGGAAAA